MFNSLRASASTEQNGDAHPRSCNAVFLSVLLSVFNDVGCTFDDILRNREAELFGNIEVDVELKALNIEVVDSDLGGSRTLQDLFNELTGEKSTLLVVEPSGEEYLGIKG